MKGKKNAGTHDCSLNSTWVFLHILSFQGSFFRPLQSLASVKEVVPESCIMPFRILCLHGMGASAAIFASQTGLLQGTVLYMNLPC